MIMPIQLLKLSAVNKEGSESVLIHCLFYIAMRSEEAAGGRLCRSISHKSILPNLLYERDVTSTIIPPMINSSYISLVSTFRFFWNCHLYQLKLHSRIHVIFAKSFLWLKSEFFHQNSACIWHFVFHSWTMHHFWRVVQLRCE